MPWPKTGAIYYHAQLVFLDIGKGRLIKVMVVLLNTLGNWARYNAIHTQSMFKVAWKGHFSFKHCVLVLATLLLTKIYNKKTLKLCCYSKSPLYFIWFLWLIPWKGVNPSSTFNFKRKLSFLKKLIKSSLDLYKIWL